MAIDVVDKIQKLLALSQSSNPAEAALAAARAQELMLKHKIAMADLRIAGDDSVKEQVQAGSLGGNRTRKVVWRGALGQAVAAAFSCEAIWMGRDLTLIGHVSDLQAATYVFQYLEREIDRLGRESLEAKRGELPGAAAIRWLNSFRIGAVNMVNVRLQRQKQEQEDAARRTAQTAMVLVKKDEAEVAQFIQQEFGKITEGKQSRTERDVQAMYEGQEAARKIDLNAKGGALGAAKSEIKGRN